MKRLFPTIRSFIRKSYYFFSKLGLFHLRHTLAAPQYSVEEASTITQELQNLESLILADKPQIIRILSYPYRESLVNGVPTIELWSVTNNKFYSQNPLYRETQYFQLRRRLSLPDKFISSPLAVLPHMTNHFGHWIGDFFGTILFYSRFLSLHSIDRKLLVLAPTQDWASYLSTIGSCKNLFFVDPNDCLYQNLVLKDALMLPRLSPWQNMSLARNYSLSYLTSKSPSQTALRRKIFLYSGRSSRIANIDEILSIFVSHGYSAINPLHENPAELLRQLFSADLVWTEHGSMILNLILSRTRPFTMLSPGKQHLCTYQSESFMHGGGVYNAFLHGLSNTFECNIEPFAPENVSHPYQHQLVVDTSLLASTLSLEKLTS